MGLFSDILDAFLGVGEYQNKNQNKNNSESFYTDPADKFYDYYGSYGCEDDLCDCDCDCDDCY